MVEYVSEKDNPLVGIVIARDKEIESLKKENETLKAALAVAEQQIIVLKDRLFYHESHFGYGKKDEVKK